MNITLGQLLDLIKLTDLIWGLNLFFWIIIFTADYRKKGFWFWFSVLIIIVGIIYFILRFSNSLII